MPKKQPRPRTLGAKSETDLGLGWWELPEHENYPVPRDGGRSTSRELQWVSVGGFKYLRFLLEVR